MTNPNFDQLLAVAQRFNQCVRLTGGVPELSVPTDPLEVSGLNSRLKPYGLQLVRVPHSSHFFAGAARG